MKVLANLKGLYLAWFSKDFYSQVVHKWHGLGLQFLMGVLVIGWAVVAVKVQYEVVSYIDGFIIPIFKQMPELNLSDGKLTMNRESPVVVKNPKTGKAIVTIDLSENAKQPPKEVEGLFFIKNKEIIQVNGARRTYTLKGDWKTPLISKENLAVLERLKQYSGITYFVIFFIAAALFATIQVFVYGLIGFASSSMLHRPLTYLQSGRIATIALLPQITLDFAQRLTPLKIPFWLPFSIVLTIVYLYFGIKAVSPTVNRETSPDHVNISTNGNS